MRYLSFKANCRFKQWTPALARILDVLHTLLNQYAWLPELVITSVNDSGHSKKPLSRHYTNEALDIRTNNFEMENDKLHFVELLKELLSPKFYIAYESIGTDNEHIHIQVKKGGAYP